MENREKILKGRIALKNYEKEKAPENKEAQLKRLIIVMGVISLLSVALIAYTLPIINLSKSSLVVISSTVSLIIFLFVLIVRYFSILVMAYLNLTKYSVLTNPEYQPFVSIIVPVYNEGKVLKDSINSLSQLDYPNYEIIIVNDGSTDDTAEVARSLVGYTKGLVSDIKISLINKPNGGKSRALNAGIQFSRADFFVCVDGDSQLSAQTLKEGMKHFVDPSVGAVAGNVKVENRRKLLTDLQALEYLEGLNMARSAQSYVRVVNIIPGPIGIFRRKAIEDAGYYSSDTFAEDADLTLKILAAGWKIQYEQNAISYTEAPQTLNQLLKQRYRWTRGILQAIRKHKRHLVNPTLNFSNTLVLWSMYYESLIWPAMNIFSNLFFIVIALGFGMSNLLSLWWIIIALLDLMTALYCVSVEKEDFRLVPYAILYRLGFILIVDITKVMATIEEFLGIEMNWGKLERVGFTSSSHAQV